jgi:hypothetical protein
MVACKDIVERRKKVYGRVSRNLIVIRDLRRAGLNGWRGAKVVVLRALVVVQQMTPNSMSM